MATATSLSLLKGGKKSVDEELEKGTTAPEPEATEDTTDETQADPEEGIEETIEVDVDKMSGPDIDKLVAENGIEVPENWKKLKVADKRSWLKEQFDDSDANEAADETETAAEAAVSKAKDEPGIVAGVDLSDGAESQKTETTAVAKVDKPKKGKTLEKAAQSGEVSNPGDDVLADLVFQIENMKEKEARALVGTLNEETEVTFFRLGGVLSVIQANGWFSPYASFREFIESEHGINYRRGMYWVGIYNSLAESKVPWSKVSTLGWSKLKEIASVLTNENVDEWVDVAKQNNVIALIDIVKNHKAGGGTKALSDQSNSATVTTKTFKVHDEQKANIEAAISKAKEDGGTAVDTVALELICLDYLGGETLATKLKNMGLEAALAAFEKAFPNVDLTVDTGEAGE